MGASTSKIGGACETEGGTGSSTKELPKKPYHQMMEYYKNFNGTDGGIEGGIDNDNTLETLFSGGVEKTTLGEISSYDVSLNSRAKDRLIDDIISAMKSLGLSVEGKDRADTINKILDKIPNEKKSGSRFKSDAESQKKLCLVIAKVFNEKYGNIIDTNQNAPLICQQIAELTESLGVGMHAEFLLVNNEVKKVLKNLFYLKDELNDVMEPLLKKIEASDDKKLVAESANYRELYALLTKEIQRQIEILKNLLDITLLPSETDLTIMLKESEDLPGIIEKLEGKAGTTRFGEVISRVLRGTGLTAKYALVIDNALKKVGVTIDEYARSDNMKLLMDKIRDTLVKKDMTDYELHEFLQSVELLYKNFYRNKDIAKLLKNMSEKSGAFEHIEYGGGTENEKEPKSIIDKRVHDKRVMKKILLKAFNRQLLERFDKIIIGLNNLAEKVGSTLPLSEQLDKLRNSLTLLSPIIMTKNIYIALSGYYNDALSRERKESFIAQLKLVKGSLDAVMASSLYTQHQDIFKQVRDSIISMIELIDTYSDKIAEKFGSGSDEDLEETPMEGGGKYSKITINDPGTWRSTGTIYDAIRKFDYYYKVAQIRENLKRTAGELDYYSEKYVDMRAQAVAKAVDEIKADRDKLLKMLKERKGFSNKSQSDTIPDDNILKDEEEYISMFVRAQAKSKINFWRTVEAIDEYMRVFTDGLAKHPDDVKEIKNMLDEIDLIHDWYSEASGKALHELFDMFPSHRKDINETTDTNTKWNGLQSDEHYYSIIEDLNNPVPNNKLDILPGNPFIAVELNDKYKDSDIGFKGRTSIRKIIKGVTVLKNILNIFIHIGNQFGGQELHKKVYMTPAQIYNNLCDYLEASAFNMGLEAPSIEYFVPETNAKSQIITMYDSPGNKLAKEIPVTMLNFVIEDVKSDADNKAEVNRKLKVVEDIISNIISNIDTKKYILTTQDRNTFEGIRKDINDAKDNVFTTWDSAAAAAAAAADAAAVAAVATDKEKWAKKFNNIVIRTKELLRRIGIGYKSPGDKRFGAYEGGVEFKNFSKTKTYSYGDDLADFDAKDWEKPIMVGATAGIQTGDEEQKKKITFLQNFTVYMRGVDRGLDGDNQFRLLDDMFVHVIKSMCAKVLTVVGTYDVFERPYEIHTMSPIRLIMGGFDEVPKVESGAIDLYLRLPLLAEFYRDLFAWTTETDNSFIKNYEDNYNSQNTDKFAEKITIVPEVEGTFSGLIRLMFKRIRNVNSASYSDTDVSELIREINIIYSKMLQRSSKDKVIMDTIYEFINEINRRYGIVRQKERDKYEKEFGSHYDYADIAKGITGDIDRDYAILPGEEDIEYQPDMSSRAPSIQYESGIPDSASARRKSKFSIKDDHYRLFYRFRCKLDEHFRSLSGKPLETREYTLNPAIKSAKNQLEKETDPAHRFKIVSKLIRGSNIYGKPDYNKYVMFHETVVAGLNVLSAIHTLLWGFQNCVLTLDLETLKKLSIDGEYTSATVKKWKDKYYGEDRNIQGFKSIENELDKQFANIYEDKKSINGLAFVREKAYLAYLFETIFAISKDLQGLVSVSFESSGEKRYVRMSFTGLKQLIEDEFASVRYFMDLLRPHIDSSIFNNYNDKTIPGSYYWLQEQIMEKIIIGRDIEIKDLKSPYVSLDRLPSIINNSFELLIKEKKNFDGYLKHIIYFDSSKFNNTSSSGTDNVLRTNPAIGILFNDSKGLEKLIAKNMGNVRLINPEYTARYKHLYNWDNEDFNNNRSIMYAFNQLLAKYIGMFFDKSVDKIYTRLIDQFASGAFNQQVMDQTKTYRDMVNTNVTVGEQQTYTSQTSKSEVEARNIVGDPTTAPKLPPGSSTNTFEKRIKYSTNLGPDNYITARITDEITSSNDKVDNKFGDTNEDTKKDPKFVLYTSLSITLKNLLTSKNESTQQNIYLADNLSDVTFYMKETYRANLPIFRNLFVELMNKCEYYKEIVNTFTVNNKEVKNEIMTQIVNGCNTLVTSIDQVIRELGDDPKYLETHQNSIQEYMNLHGKLPFMPASSLLYVLKNVGKKDSGDFLTLFPLQAPGTTKGRFNYGIRSIFGDHTSKVLMDHMPGVKEVFDNFNSSVDAGESANASNYDKHISTLVRLLRFIVDSKHYKGNLTPYVQKSFEDDPDIDYDGTKLNTQTINNTGVFTRRDFVILDSDKEQNYYANKSFQSLISYKNKKPLIFCYAISKSLSDILTLTESSFKDDRIEDLVKYIGSDDLIKTKDKLNIINIIDLNVVPINVHALMRDIPLVNLYNYSYTFDRLIVELFYGLNEDFSGTIIKHLCDNALDDPGMHSMPGIPEDQSKSESMRSKRPTATKSTRELFVALLINPYRKIWTDAEYQFLDAIFRGSGNLPLDRPKFLSDQVHGKLMFRDSTELAEYDKDKTNPFGFNRAYERGPSHTRQLELEKATDKKKLYYIPNNQKDPNDYKFDENDTKSITIDENLKQVLQLIGKLRFNTRFIRNLFFLVNLYRSLRYKLRIDLTYNKNLVVKSHAVIRPDNTEFMLNQTKEDSYKGSTIYPRGKLGITVKKP